MKNSKLYFQTNSSPFPPSEPFMLAYSVPPSVSSNPNPNPSPSPNPNLINVNNNTNKSTQALKQLFCGGVAGALAKTLTAPLSRLVILFQVHSLVSSKKSSAPQFATGAISGAQKILTREGAWAFWKGNGTSVLHRFPYSGINFFVYEKALQRLTPAEPALPLTVFCSRFGAGGEHYMATDEIATSTN